MQRPSNTTTGIEIHLPRNVYVQDVHPDSDELLLPDVHICLFRAHYLVDGKSFDKVDSGDVTLVR